MRFSRRGRPALLAFAIVIAAVTVAACSAGPGTGPPTTSTTHTASATASPSVSPPAEVTAAVTLTQVRHVAAEAKRQGALSTFSRTDPSGIVVVRRPDSSLSEKSLRATVNAAGNPLVQVVDASEGSVKQSLAREFRAYSRSHTRPGAYLTFRYDSDHHVFRLATNAPPASLERLLEAHGDALVVTYASPGCLVCGG